MRAEEEEPPIGAECAYEMETFAGYWSNIHITRGVTQAVVLGEARLGDNSCLDFVRRHGIFQLSYFARNDLVCDDVAPQVSCDKEGII